MFAKRFHLLLNHQIHMNYWRLHSTSNILKVNLTIKYQQTKRNNVYFKNQLLPISTTRSYSNLSTNRLDDLNDDENNEFVISKKGKERVTENGFSYKILSSSDKYCKTVVPLLTPDKHIPNDVVDKILAKDYEEFSVTELLEDFKTLSCHARLNLINPTQEIHSKLFGLITKYISDLWDDQMWELMKYMELWFPMKRETVAQSFLELIKAIDKSLCLKMTDLTVDEMLMGCDLMYHLRYVRKSDFIHKVMIKLGSKPKRLTPENYVHYMFLFVISRKTPINMYELEYALESIVDKFEANELGIVALAFFKTQTPIRNPALLDKIIERCITDMDKMDDISISAIMKIVRLSIGLNRLESFRRLFKTFESHISSASPPCLVHAGHAAATILVYEKNIIDQIVEKFLPQIQNSRVKDIERLLFVLSIFNYPKDTPHYELILDELRNPVRTTELQKFYKSLTYSLMYLAHIGIYPLDIIARIMDHGYLRNNYNNDGFKIGQEYLLIENSLRIEVPEYKGPTLPPKIRNYLIKKSTASLSYNENSGGRLHSYQKFNFEVVNYAKEILGPEKYMINQLLPHYQRADIVFCVDNENNYISPKEFFTEISGDGIKYAPKVPEGYKFKSIVLASQNHVFRGTSITCGTFNSKLRQLEKIGYTPIVILYKEWQEAKSKKDLLQNLLFQNDNSDKIK